MKKQMTLAAITALLFCGSVAVKQVAALKAVSPQTGCIPAPSGLVAWWPGDGNANDIRGNNNGALQNGATFAPGLAGQAFSFDGVDDVVLAPDSPDLNFNSASPITVDLWALRTGTSPVMHLVGKRSGCSGGLFNYQMALNTLSGQGLQFGSGFGPGNEVATGMDLPLNTWTHLAGSFDGSSFRFYINGQLVATSAGLLGPTTTAPLVIGGAGTCATFAGLIDEVEIHNRALSDSEIHAIYNAGSAGKCKGAATVSIDIKPGSDPNSINCQNQNGVIPVVILTTSAFDATTVDPLTVRFGPASATETHGAGHIEDVDGDGDLDMVLHFRFGHTGIQCGDTQATLTGATFSGQAITGTDAIRTVGE